LYLSTSFRSSDEPAQSCIAGSQQADGPDHSRVLVSYTIAFPLQKLVRGRWFPNRPGKNETGAALFT
jgi:hypothetical protein